MALASVALSVLLALGCAGTAFAEEETSNDGLPSGIPVPLWAAGKSIHFDPARPVAGVTEPGLAELAQPLLTPEEERLKYFEGPVEYEPRLFLIFWGSNWNKEPGTTLKGLLLKFYEGVKESAYQKILTQYDSPDGRISQRPEIESQEEDDSIAAPSNVNEAAVEKKAEEFRDITGSKKNINDQFIVLPAPGSTYEKGFDSETGFCGYHERLPNEYGSFDFIPYAGDPPFSEVHIIEQEGKKKEYYPCTYYGADEEESSKYNADYATSGSASHEYAESVTDPETKKHRAWVRSESGQQEIADVCGSLPDDQMSNGAWVVNLFDNTMGACEVADESPVLQEIGPYTNSAWENTEYIKPNSAEMVGGMEPCGLEGHYFFEYGKTEALGKTTAESTFGSGYWGVVRRGVAISELEPNTLYYWRVVVKTSHGSKKGAIRDFETPYYPLVQTKAATKVMATRTTLNGTVNPEGYASKYWFESGTTTSYGTKSMETSAGSGTTSVEETKGMTGLTPGKAYDYRIVASNSGGTTDGKNEVVTTPTSSVPFVESRAATGTTETKSMVNGVVDPEGAEAKYYFEYGTTTSYGTKSMEASAGSGTTSVEEGSTISKLTPSTTYHFRAVATNTHGTTDGADEVFSTTGKPTVETKPATGLTLTGATLNGAVNPRGTEAKYWFESGGTTSYGTKSMEASAGSGTTNIEGTKGMTGLHADTTYHYRVVASNTHGTTYGEDKTLTTTEPDWYVKEAGVWKAVSEPVKVETEAKVTISDTEWGGKGLVLAESCEGTYTGELKSGGTASIETIAIKSCKAAEVGEKEINFCERPEGLEMRDTPWTTEFYKEGGEDRAKIGGSGTPYWTFECKTIGGTYSDVCGANSNVHMTNDTSTGTVEAAYDAKSNKTTCSGSPSGNEAGEWRGTLTIKATLKEVEAIKVE